MIGVCQYKQFRLKTQKKAGFPLAAQIELTRRCNLNCPYCYLGSLKNNSKDLSFGKIRIILDKLRRAGIIWIFFSGGEPLCRPDFNRIYKYAREQGFIAGVLTNGILINRDKIELFKKYPPLYLEIPLNAADEPVCAKMTGKNGQFKKLLKSLELLKKNNIPFKLKTKITNLNLDSLKRIKRLGRRFGRRLSLSSLLYPANDGSKSPLKFQLTQKAEVCRRNKFQCAPLSFALSVDSSGNLTPCEIFRKPAVSMLKYEAVEAREKLLKMLEGWR